MKPDIVTYNALFPFPPRQKGQPSGVAGWAWSGGGFGHQDAPRSPPGRHHFTPYHATSSHTTSQEAQDAPKTPQDAPKTPQDAPKTTPPRGSQEAPGTPQNGPKWTPETPSGSRCRKANI